MFNKTTILIIEDEANVNNIIATTITSEGYNACQSFSGTEGLSMIYSLSPDLVLLDLVLPDMSGMEVIRKVRLFSDVPIIVISALCNEKQKVEALDLGADDYLIKPYGSSELLARIRAVYRHVEKIHEAESCTETFQVGRLLIDLKKHESFVDGVRLRLTPIEFRLISLLAQNAGKVLTNSFIMTTIWGPYVSPDTGIIRVNIANIRRKIEKNPADPEYIFTEPGVGYRMTEP
ncbi:MAG: response regulator transcription factor [Lachnospiraceae bacterium]|nr:response regulator transcription factor [Lachnospiraceae bacterium]